MTQPHENLVAWQRADELCVAIYKLTRTLPVDERFAMSTQMRRAAFSVAANIVEGYAFPKSRVRLRFLRTALASLAEVGYATHLAHRIGYLSDEEWAAMDQQLRQVAAPLHGLIRQQSKVAGSDSA
jgi:four helix bundle protein